MKKIFFLCMGLAVGVAEAATVSPSLVPTNAADQVEAKRTADLQARRERARASRAAREKAEADKHGIAVAELRKRRAEERRAFLAKRDAEMAAKAGISVEEYRAQRCARHDAMLAKRLGVTVEEVGKMTPEQKMSRYQEMRAKHQAEVRARRAKEAAALTNAVPAAVAK